MVGVAGWPPSKVVAVGRAVTMGRVIDQVANPSGVVVHRPYRSSTDKHSCNTHLTLRRPGCRRPSGDLTTGLICLATVQLILGDLAPVQKGYRCYKQLRTLPASCRQWRISCMMVGVAGWHSLYLAVVGRAVSVGRVIIKVANPSCGAVHRPYTSSSL